jgi:5-methyltetrahydropteroyltriglutamate--homocysteine methyltransferase
MEVALESYEIGSLAKPEWRAKALAGKPLADQDLEEARRWGKKLSIDYDLLIELLARGQSTGHFDSAAKREIQRWASLYAIRMLEQTGLDVVYDGEQQRSEMYQYPITHAQGFQFRGLVRSFNNKYYQKAACVAESRLVKPYHVEEFKYAQSHARKSLKVPLTGAYTLADWSYDEYYAGQVLEIGSAGGRARQQEVRREYILAVARNLVRPNVKALLDAGATWIQIDEPAATTQPEEIPLFVESFNESVRGLKGRFTTHVCFSDYTLLCPHIENLMNCWGLCIGFANYDSHSLGRDPSSRPGYTVLRRFADLGQKFHIGVGVFDIHTDYIEPPSLIRDRLLYAMDLLGVDWVNPCADCGLRTRTWEIAYEKLSNMMEAVEGLRSNL